MELVNQRKTGSQPQKYEKQTEPILRLDPRPLRPGPSNNSQREEDFSTRSRGEGQRYVSALCLCRNVEGFSDQNIIDQTNFGGIFSNFFSFAFSYNQEQIYRPYGMFPYSSFTHLIPSEQIPNQSSHILILQPARSATRSCFAMRIVRSQCSSS